MAPHNTQRIGSAPERTGAQRTGAERVCGNCRRAVRWIARNRCSACYYYRQRHGVERPPTGAKQRRGRSFKGPQWLAVDTGQAPPERGPCHLWQWGRFRNGYPRICFGGRYMMAHRLSYIMQVGHIPPGYELHHVCEIKHCINPEHLQCVTREEHLRLTPRVKLSPEKAQEIRELHAAGWKPADLAARYGVEVTAIYRVLKGKRWRGADRTGAEHGDPRAA